MSAVVAGVKRSYFEMADMLGPRDTGSGGTSRTQSPFRTPTSAWDKPPDFSTNDRANGRTVLSRRASIEPSASVVLIGVRGVGKSTLGVLAATAYNRRLIETERAFSEATGSTAVAYRKQKGTVEYQKRHNQILQDTLRTNSVGAVIVSSFSDLEGEGANIVRDYSKTHPVIHVSRDAEGIRSHLRVWTSDRINELLSASGSLLRKCSNYEFLNLSESKHGSEKNDGRNGSLSGLHEDSSSNGSFLTLKRVERDFIRFLRNVIGDHERQPVHHSAYPFSYIELESRTYTFAVTTSVSEVVSNTVDLDEMQIGADCIELVVDGNMAAKRRGIGDVSLAFAMVRRATVLPILLTATKAISVPQQSRAEIFELTRSCFRLGPDLCTVDLDLQEPQLLHLISCRGRSKVIALSEKDERPSKGWNDRVLLDSYVRAANLGCDLVKITMPAQSAEDAFEISSFQRTIGALNMAPRLIAYNTGHKGRSSKCFNKILTSVEPPNASEDASRDRTISGENGVTAKAVTEALFASFVFEPMRIHLCGADVSYSVSPAMHNVAYQACGMRYIYEARSTDNLEEVKTLMHATDSGGIALAQPFKTILASMMNGLSPHAKAIGAINTILPVRELSTDGAIPEEPAVIAQRNQQGPVKALYGFNTDWIGLRACIRRGLSPANIVRSHSSGLVCGAGGMARSAIYSLISLGFRNIFICNRTFSKAEALAEHYNSLVTAGDIPELDPEGMAQTRVRVLESFTSSWPSDVRQPTVIISCIPRQAAGEPPTNFSLPEAWLKSPTGGVVVEFAYSQLKSLISQQLKERAQKGWIFLDGISVLPEQAFAQFELFTGRRAPRKLMRDELLKHSSSDSSIDQEAA